VYTIDASVWVNAFDRREPEHAASRRLLDLIAAQAIPVFVPNLVLAEVAGAISRTRKSPADARAFATALGDLPNVRLVPLDDVSAHQAVGLAAQHGLRGADAVYAVVAMRAGTALLTLDDEHLTRLAGVVSVRTPAAELAALASRGRS